MPITFKTMQEEYDDFMLAVFAKIEISPVQYQEMRRAFFAGAWLMCQVANQIGEPHVTEDEAIAYMNAVSRELEAFKSSMLPNQTERN